MHIYKGGENKNYKAKNTCHKIDDLLEKSDFNCGEKKKSIEIVATEYLVEDSFKIDIKK